jgi:hypothetical protein
LTDRDAVLFHGSADGGLDILHPRRTSYEYDDQAGRGNRAAVYATHDGWWALWFAVIDRDLLRGTMRSGVETFHGPQQRLPVYFFSVDYRVLPSRPFATDGCTCSHAIRSNSCRSYPAAHRHPSGAATVR